MFVTKKFNLPPLLAEGNICYSRKKIIISFLLVIAVTLILSATFVSAATCNCDAVSGEHIKGETYPCTKGWDVTQKIAFSWLSATENINISNFSGLYKINFDSGIFGTLWDGLESIYELVIPIGYLLVILYFVLEIIEHTTRDSFNIEQLIKMLIKLFVGVIFITNGLKLLKGVATFNNGLVDLFTGAANGGDGAGSQSSYDMVKNLGFWDSLGIILQSFIPYILSLISALVIILTILSRYLDIAVRALFAPIGMANVFEGGLNSSGMKYFKKYMAAILQGVIMCGVMIVSEKLSIALSAASGIIAAIPVLGLGTTAVYLVLQLCTAAMIVKSKSIANDLLGV